MEKLVINTDGGSRGNPGKAASACVIKDSRGELLYKGGVYVGLATNNEAEYQAVKFALKVLADKFPQHLPAGIQIKADSQLVVNQLCGKFKIKNPRLKVLIEEIKKLEGEVGEVDYTYIPRSENYEADRLVNEILDKHI